MCYECYLTCVTECHVLQVLHDLCNGVLHVT